MPGLSGDSSELYCIAVAKSCLRRNLDLVVVNYRGAAGIPLKTAKMYTAAETGDLTEVVEYLHKKYVLDDQGRKTRAFTGVGISLGASILALYAAKIGARNPFDA